MKFEQVNKLFTAWYGGLWLCQFNNDITPFITREWFDALEEISFAQVNKILEGLKRADHDHTHRPPTVLQFKGLAREFPVDRTQDPQKLDKELKHEIWMEISGWISHFQRWKGFTNGKPQPEVDSMLKDAAKGGYDAIQRFKQILSTVDYKLAEESLKLWKTKYYNEVWDGLPSHIKDEIMGNPKKEITTNV